jgi:hypothetical protein
MKPIEGHFSPNTTGHRAEGRSPYEPDAPASDHTNPTRQPGILSLEPSRARRARMNIPRYEGGIQGGPEPTSSSALPVVKIPRWPIGLEDPSLARFGVALFSAAPKEAATNQHRATPGKREGGIREPQVRAHVVMGEECPFLTSHSSLCTLHSSVRFASHKHPRRAVRSVFLPPASSFCFTSKPAGFPADRDRSFQGR